MDGHFTLRVGVLAHGIRTRNQACHGTHACTDRSTFAQSGHDGAQRTDGIRHVGEGHHVARHDVIAGAVLVCLLVREAGTAEEAKQGEIIGIPSACLVTACALAQFYREDGGSQHLSPGGSR
jgi:hypothetical protein